MKYALVHNDKIQVGPRDYIKTPFQDYINENGFAFVLPRVYDSSLPIIEPDWRIIPVTETVHAPLTQFEQPAGPFYTIGLDSIKEEYTAVPKNIDALKNEFKAIVAANRYIKETSDLKLTIQDTEVSIEGNRTNKMMVIQIHGLMNDDTIYNFKFLNDVWLALTKTDMTIIVSAFVKQTQDAFNWEQYTVTTIDNAVDFTELGLIDLGYPLIQELGLPHV